MSANNDTPMTRFLFAILRQKNLKDIDWNQVAHDPILNHEITNGHAARMRYSRFRGLMLGGEKIPRNRTGPTKSRVSKSKKEPKGKKGEAVKSETAPESPVLREPSETPAPEIKQESSSYEFDSRFTPRLTPGPRPMPTDRVMPCTPAGIQPRLLTPASDSDFFSPSPMITSSPVSDMISAHTSFDFRGSPCPERPDPMWSSVPPYDAYSPNYPFGDYSSRPCDHPHIHPDSRAEFLNPTPEPEGGFVFVKQEDWDQYH